MAADTTAPSYWLNWRFFLCALWVFATVVVSSFLIWKYEGFTFGKSRPKRREHQEVEPASSVYEDEAWKTCLKGIKHPAWLLAYRIVAFAVLFSVLVANAVVDGGDIFFFYTQWTFALVTVYFVLGSLLSIYGVHKYRRRFGGDAKIRLDAEQGTCVAHILEENLETLNLPKDLNAEKEFHSQTTTGIWIKIFQIVFQVSAGAVVLTDCVFWFIIYPFLTPEDYRLDFLTVSMHSMNAFFLLGDTILNCLRFPLFRFAYFMLWTGLFVIFQWIIHACVSISWPYPFLDLSSSYAPLWYIGLAAIHIPCYAVFALIIRIKNILLSRSVQESNQSAR